MVVHFGNFHFVLAPGLVLAAFFLTAVTIIGVGMYVSLLKCKD